MHSAQVVVLTESSLFEVNFHGSLSSILLIGIGVQLDLAFTNIMIADEVAENPHL